VRSSHIKAPQVVRRGDRVILEASTAGISVVTTGTALANGKVGEQIQVRNEKSARVVDAEIIGPGKARVAL
jgi:flagella basal body P-ring formation protein FlgA